MASMMEADGDFFFFVGFSFRCVNSPSFSRRRFFTGFRLWVRFFVLFDTAAAPTAFTISCTSLPFQIQHHLVFFLHFSDTLKQGSQTQLTVPGGRRRRRLGEAWPHGVFHKKSLIKNKFSKNKQNCRHVLRFAACLAL